MLQLGFYGHSNSGKTTVIDGLVARYRRRGLSVAVVKHTAHRGFELDSEGTDSWRHGRAGAVAVGLLADGRAAILIHRIPPGVPGGIRGGGGIPDDTALLIRLVKEAVHPDILFMEGFKHSTLDKVAVGDIAELPGTVLRVDPGRARSLRALERFVERRLKVQRVRDLLPGQNCGKCGLDCARFAESVAEGRRRLAGCVNLSGARLKLAVDGEEVALGRFPKEIVASGLLGLVAPLKLPVSRGVAGPVMGGAGTKAGSGGASAGGGAGAARKGGKPARHRLELVLEL
jgi:molybdopterin-guanine dinucleotide biosynthesis protein B